MHDLISIEHDSKFILLIRGAREAIEGAIIIFVLFFIMHERYRQKKSKAQRNGPEGQGKGTAMAWHGRYTESHKEFWESLQIQH